MHFIPRFFIRALAFAITGIAQGQPGTNDATFNPSDVGNGVGDGPAGSVHAYAVLPDGKVIIGGYFSFVHGYARGRIARLNSDGSLDLSFDPGTGFDNTVLAVAVQADGKLIVGGDFTSCAGVARNRIARLNSDGSLDASFNPGTGFNYPVRALAMQPDGKVLVGGGFTLFNGAARTKLVRLQSNGALDAAFSPGTITGSTDIGFYALVLQGNGQIVAIGNISSVNGTSRPGIARFSTAGALDLTYPASGVIVSEGRSCALQADGKLVMGAYFGVSATGFPSRLVARLNVDGTYDSGFAAPAFTYPPLTPNVAQVAIRADGKVIISGEFSFNLVRRSMARLNTNGSLDPLFTGGYFGNFALLPDSRIICASGTTRLDPDGIRDPSYYPGSGCNMLESGNGPSVLAIVVQPDGHILLGGGFSRYQGQDAPGVVRLGPDGIRDPGFTAVLPSLGSTSYYGNNVQDLAFLPDGKVLVAREGVDRLNDDGSPDPTFDDGTGGNSNGAVRRRLALLPDGKLLVAGDFTQYNGQNIRGLVRLNTNGTVDPTFDASAVFTSSTAHALALQPDGRILVYNGYSVLRLLADGAMDPTFTGPNITGDASQAHVNVIALQPDGAVLIGGALSACNGQPRKGIARLLANGTLDASFNTSGPDIYQVFAIAVQSDGRIIIAGGNDYYGAPRRTIARLNTDGSLDAGFSTGTGFAYYGYVYCRVEALALQADGRVLAGGTFTAYNGTGRNRIVRLNGDGTAYVDLAAKVLLDGPYNTTTQLMNDGLRAGGFVLTDEPYSALGYEYTGTGAGTVSSGVLTTTGNNAIVDWVLVELRDRDDATNVLASRAALVQRDGDVVDVDGHSPVRFGTLPGNYSVSVRHRNHLGAMSATSYALGPQVMALDFTHPSTPTYGTDARKPIGSKMALWAGDVTFNGQVKYTGPGNDRDPILTAVGSFAPNTIITGYRQEDVNLDGLVKYTGLANDRDPILVNVGGTVPTTVRMQQLP
jgi:uncharacterized delta-60 repeat protein